MYSMHHTRVGPPPSPVEIGVSCRNLKNKDGLSKSDPQCYLYTNEFGSSSLSKVGNTETVKNSLNPDFVKKFTVDYYFEVQQKLKIVIFDSDDGLGDLDGDDFIGFYEISLGSLVASGSKTSQLKAKGEHGVGEITIHVEQVAACKDVLHLKLSGSKLDKKDVIGKSDPFITIYKANPDESFTAVHKTEVIKNTLNPEWREFSIPLTKLSNGDWDRPLKIDCSDSDKDGGHDCIGQFMTTARQLVPETKFELINPKKQAKKKGYKNSGVIKVESVRVTQQATFMDYLQAGLVETTNTPLVSRKRNAAVFSKRVQINFTVAVDFTGSNGESSDPNSLHYIQPNCLNQYGAAIWSVGNIIQDYDSDKMFPALGFGAKLPDGNISHEFFLNGNPASPFCAGIQDILDAYYNAIRTVQLWGPTNFAPVIRHVSRFGAAVKDGSNYFVLLILTDGVITDFVETVQAIAEASTFPVSIIIVGVGDADFTEMELLDDSLKGIVDRDIVQFVAMQDYLDGGNSFLTQARLAKDVLAEVPDQFLGYMKKHNIQPPQQRINPASVHTSLIH